MSPAPSRMLSTGRRLPFSRGDPAGSLSTEPTRYSSIVCREKGICSLGGTLTEVLHATGCQQHIAHVCSAVSRVVVFGGSRWCMHPVTAGSPYSKVKATHEVSIPPTAPARNC